MTDTFKIQRDHDTDGFVVVCRRDGKRYEPACYYTDDRDDATSTMDDMIARQDAIANMDDIITNTEGLTGYQAVKVALSCAVRLIDLGMTRQADQLIRTQIANGLTGRDLDENMGADRVKTLRVWSRKNGATS